MQRRQFASALLALGAMPLAAGAQPSFSSKPIRIMVPFGPGGVADLTVRIVAQKMTELLGGQPIIVDNKPGAGGVVAAEQVARAAPDVRVMPGGGISAANVADFADALPLRDIHASASAVLPEPALTQVAAFGFQPPGARGTDAGLVRALRDRLDQIGMSRPAG